MKYLNELKILSQDIEQVIKCDDPQEFNELWKMELYDDVKLDIILGLVKQMQDLLNDS